MERRLLESHPEVRMNSNSTLTIGALVLTGIFAVACSGSGGSSEVPDAPPVPPAPTTPHAGEKNTSSTETGAATGGTTPAPGKEAAPAEAGEPGEAGQDGADGEAGRIAVNGHCCYQGKYFACPDENACFGGFDLQACFAACGANIACFETCAEKIDTAGAPKGCRTGVTPPKGVDCANGKIDL
jgi:hypothetical protein